MAGVLEGAWSNYKYTPENQYDNDMGKSPFSTAMLVFGEV